MSRPASNVTQLDQFRSAQGAAAAKVLRPTDAGAQRASREIRTPGSESKRGVAVQYFATLLGRPVPNASWIDLLRKLGTLNAEVADTRPQRRATKSERDKWASFLLDLASDEKLPKAQRAAALDVWQRAIETEPNVMYPTVAPDPEAGTMYFSWNPRGLSLEIEIDSSGRLQWHFADHGTGHFEGSSEPENLLAPKALTLLRLFRRAEDVGRVPSQR